MAIATYEPIYTTTLGSAQSSINLSSFGGYTDLLIIINSKTTGNTNAWLQFNSDTASNYSDTRLEGNGSSATSSRNSNATKIYIDSAGYDTTGWSSKIINIFNYTNTTTYKTVLTRSNNPAIGLDAIVGLWRKTPEAITTIKIGLDSNSFDTGSTFTLYGILAA